jgi:hypothetical protein
VFARSCVATLDRDFEQELEAHLAMLIDDNVRSGMSLHEATRAVRLRLGPAEFLKARHPPTHVVCPRSE